MQAHDKLLSIQMSFTIPFKLALCYIFFLNSPKCLFFVQIFFTFISDGNESRPLLELNHSEISCLETSAN